MPTSRSRRDEPPPIEGMRGRLRRALGGGKVDARSDRERFRDRGIATGGALLALLFPPVGILLALVAVFLLTYRRAYVERTVLLVIIVLLVGFLLVFTDAGRGGAPG